MTSPASCKPLRPAWAVMRSRASEIRSCTGLGVRFDFNQDQLVPDDSLSIQKGAIALLGKLSSVGKWRKHILKGVGRAIEIDLGMVEDSFFKTKWRDLPAEAMP